MFLTGYVQPPTTPVQLLGFPFTCFLHVSYRLPFFHLHAFYMFLTGPLFSFTCFLHVPYRPPFFIYMLFTCFLQVPFYHLHGFYMFLTGPPFSFTWFLQGYKHNISRLFTSFAWIIYTFLTRFSKAIYMFFTKADTVKVRKIFYRFLHVLQMIIVAKTM